VARPASPSPSRRTARGCRSPTPPSACDKGFYLPSELPADGVLRIADQGDLPHQVTAFRLPASTSYAEARRLLIHGRSLERLGTATMLSGLVSSDTVNRVEARLRRGRYLVASLYAPLTRTADRTSSAASLRPPGSTEPTTAAAVLGLRRQ